MRILTSNICVVQWERKKVAGILPDVPSSCTYRYPSLLHYAQVCGAHYACSHAESQETKVTLKEGKQNIWWKCIWAAYPEDHYLQSGSVHRLLHLLWATDTDKRSKDLIFSSWRTQVTWCLVPRTVRSVKKYKQVNVLIPMKIWFITGRTFWENSCTNRIISKDLNFLNFLFCSLLSWPGLQPSKRRWMPRGTNMVPQAAGVMSYMGSYHFPEGKPCVINSFTWLKNSLVRRVSSNTQLKKNNHPFLQLPNVCFAWLHVICARFCQAFWDVLREEGKQ